MLSFIAGFFWTLGRLTATYLFDLIVFLSHSLLLCLVIVIAVVVAKIHNKIIKVKAAK